jgi:hypothetical protein
MTSKRNCHYRGGTKEGEKGRIGEGGKSRMEDLYNLRPSIVK